MSLYLPNLNHLLMLFRRNWIELVNGVRLFQMFGSCFRKAEAIEMQKVGLWAHYACRWLSSIQVLNCCLAAPLIPQMPPSGMNKSRYLYTTSYHTVCEGTGRAKKVSAIGTPKIQKFRLFPTTYAKIKIFWRRFLEKSRSKVFSL